MADKVDEKIWDLGSLREGTSPTVRMRIPDGNGALPLAAALSSITMRVWNMTTGVPTEVGTEATLTIGSVWKDTALTNHGWTAAAGYNFEYLIPTASIPGTSTGSGVTEYRVTFKITPSAGAVIYCHVKFTVGDTPGVGS